MDLSETEKRDLAALVARTLTLSKGTSASMTDAAIWGFSRGLAAGYRRGRQARHVERFRVIR